MVEAFTEAVEREREASRMLAVDLHGAIEWDPNMLWTRRAGAGDLTARPVRARRERRFLQAR